jgi:hypothetical protein
MTTFSGTQVSIPDPSPVSATTPIVQVFCTVDEIFDDAESRGSWSESKVFEKVMAASRLLAMRTGRFLPVTETRVFGSPKDSTKLFLPFPLLSVSAIVNDGISLVSGDYILQPSGRHWDNGPYSMLEVDPEASNLSSWDTDADGISITGDVGLYNAIGLSGTTLGASIASTSATTLRASNGSLVSPGMVVVIDSERIFIKATGTPVTAVTTLSAALDSKDELFTATDGSLLNVGEIIRIGVEQAKILDISGNTVAVQRGWNKTTRAPHLISSNVDVYRNFVIERGVNGSTAATHGNSATIMRLLVPEDVKGLCRKIATRMLKDASSGYQGRVGDDATGQVMYTYILPHELDQILDMYSIPLAG